MKVNGTKLKLISITVLFVLLASSLLSGAAKAGAQSPLTVDQSLSRLTYRGTTTLANQGTGASHVSENDGTPQLPRDLPNELALNSKAPSVLPTVSPTPFGGGKLKFLGFNGISHADQRLAGSGVYTNTQFSLEPPDQGLCVGNGFVVEAVNNAIAIYTFGGIILVPPTPLSAFYHLPPEVIRTTPPVFGPFISDPKCYHDPVDDRYFITELELDTNSSTGAFTGRTHLELAVSTSGNPTSTYFLFLMDVTDDGLNGTPAHKNCPCLGDQPLIGADANGFYVSTNEFPLFVKGFNGAQLYAMSKSALEAGAVPMVVQMDLHSALKAFGVPTATVQPATIPPGGAFAKNTEYLLSSFEIFNGSAASNIALWALTGTDTLSTLTPHVKLHLAVLGSEIYNQPVPAVQNNGPRPLAAAIGGAPLEVLNADDDRMQQVEFANGMLWSSLTTGVVVSGAPTDAAAFFIVAPSFTGGVLGGTIANQGYVSVAGAFVIYPSVAVTSRGTGTISFTLTGSKMFPSTAFMTFSSSGPGTILQIAGVGAFPEDGFTGYKFFGGSHNLARWGDYSAAVVGPDNSIWMAQEFIPDTPRTFFANWGTFLANFA